MAGYFDWYVFDNDPYNVFIIWPICQDDFISYIYHSRSDICFVAVEFESAIVFYSFWFRLQYIALLQLYLDLYFTTKSFSTVKYIAYSFASS